jgi:hypothetical protein
MLKAKKSHVDSILYSYAKKLNNTQQFYHLLQEIKKHDGKLKKLKLKEDRKGHFKEEVCDVFILSSLLMQLEKINQQTLNKASQHFANKVMEIYR